MLQFGQFQDRSKKFVGLFVDGLTQSMLKRWAEENGFDLSVSYSGNPIGPNDFLFHTTVFYTTSIHTTAPSKMIIDPIEAFVEGADIFGQDRKIPVLKLKINDRLQRLRTTFEQFGYEDAWPEWKPHVSFSYNYSGDPPIEGLRLPSFPLTFNVLEIRNVEPSD